MDVILTILGIMRIGFIGVIWSSTHASKGEHWDDLNGYNDVNDDTRYGRS